MRISFRPLLWLCCLSCLLPVTLLAADPPLITQLPQTQEYQRTLRAYLATLTEADYTHGVTTPLTPDKDARQEPDHLYRQYLLTVMLQPMIGNKRGAPAVNAPGRLFTLAEIETPKGVMHPPVWPETLMPFIQWDNPGNPFHQNRALRLRAFSTSTVLLIMLDDLMERSKGQVPAPVRTDWHAYQMVYIAAAYPGYREILPPPVQQAFQAGLRRLGEQMMAWGPRGESCEHDLILPVGLLYISRALNDPAFTQQVEALTRKLFTDERHLHPAGYWVERGGPDMGFAGTANYFAVWAGLMSDWPFIKEGLDRVYRLRGHLLLPEPDGKVTGPSHFNSRLGGPASADQWSWDGAREAGAAMLTDEALHFVKTPTPAELAAAPNRRIHLWTEDLKENPRVVENGVARYINNEEIISHPWKLRIWMTYNFPTSVNPSYEFYRPGTFTKRAALEQAQSPLLKSPFLRGENFVRDFAGTFLVTRQPSYAAILHTGPIGHQSPEETMHQFPGPLGFGGGQLSAFWTPATGTVWQGMRKWMSHDKCFDQLAEWRTWPLHAVTGQTAAGTVFTSAGIRQPTITREGSGLAATVKAAGTIPASIIGQAATITGKYEYQREFKIAGDSVSVSTTVSGDGTEPIAELYETLPLYLRDQQSQAKETPTLIEWQVAGQWQPASDQMTAGIQALRLTRFTGAVLVAFTQPVRAKLSSKDWLDDAFSKATSRTLLIDLLGSEQPAPFKGPKTINYRLSAVAK